MIVGILIGIGISIFISFLFDHIVLGGAGRSLLWLCILYYVDKFIHGGNPLG